MQDRRIVSTKLYVDGFEVTESNYNSAVEALAALKGQINVGLHGYTRNQIQKLTERASKLETAIAQYQAAKAKVMKQHAKKKESKG